ncbi:MAG: multicopper oxidase family protein [Rhodospirillales bacterium]|nr:multicopper oxidase family protein [Rhodospirillales bacterium]
MALARRHFLGGAALLAVGSAAPAQAGVVASRRLTALSRTLEVNGRAARVFGLLGPDGTQGLTLDPGERFRVRLENRLAVRSIIHWHGQTPPVRQDGVAETGLEALIPPGGAQEYDFAPRSGTYWMHSHAGMQEQQLLAAPLIMRDRADLHADMQEVVLMLHDFTFRDPAEILAGLRGMGKMAGADQGMAMGGMAMPGMSMSGMSMPGMAMDGTAKPGAADLNDVAFDAYLANDRTLADPAVIRVEKAGQVRLRIINGAAATAFWIDLGGLAGQVVAADGDPVHPLAARLLPLAEAQRLDVLLRIPASGGAFPILALREGALERTGIVLATAGARIAHLPATAATPAPQVDLSLEARLRAAMPLAAQPARVQRVTLTGSMMGFHWGIDGREWPQHRPILVEPGSRVAFDLVNRTGMAHPMHLHGHRFQVIGLGGQALAGALRDTVLVPAHATVRIAFDADNPGRWLFHCHNLYHMAAGMMTEVAYRGFRDGV